MRICYSSAAGPLGPTIPSVGKKARQLRLASWRIHRREEAMSDDLSAEFESYRKRLRTDEEKQAFDRKIEELLQDRGVDYVRGYVDGLKESL
jgi:hypothetical protein